MSTVKIEVVRSLPSLTGQSYRLRFTHQNGNVLLSSERYRRRVDAETVRDGFTEGRYRFVAA